MGYVLAGKTAKREARNYPEPKEICATKKRYE
jgi:hypothetical protein